MQLLLLAEIVSIVIAVPIGVYSGYRANGKFDKFATGMAFFLLAIPSFVMGVVLITIFAVSTNLLKIQFDPISEVGLAASLKTSIMPVICISVGIIAVYVRLLRTDMIATLQEDFILNARAKGLKSSYILFRHALRPSSFSLLTVAGINLGTLIGGSVIVEQLFSIDGVGNLLVQSISSRDIATVQVIVLIISITYVARELHRRPRVLEPRPEDPPWLTPVDRRLGPRADPVPATSRASSKKRRRLGLAFWLPAVWVGLILFGAVFADLLPIQDPNIARQVRAVRRAAVRPQHG